MWYAVIGYGIKYLALKLLNSQMYKHWKCVIQ